MFDYKLNTLTHDVLIQGGDYLLVDGKAEVAQAIKIRLLTIQGEWFLDPTIGWLNFKADFRFTPNLPKMRQAVFDQIRQTPGVVSAEITLFELDRVEGNLRIEYTAVTDGNVTIEDGVSL